MDKDTPIVDSHSSSPIRFHTRLSASASARGMLLVCNQRESATDCFTIDVCGNLRRICSLGNTPPIGDNRTVRGWSWETKLSGKPLLI